MMTRRKNYENLIFTDDFMFCKILSENKELCIGFLERILCKRIRDIVYLNAQENLRSTVEAKSIYMDVYLADGDNTVYNIEMQTSGYDNIPFRSRYYQSTIDVNLLSHGMRYEELNKSYIIFVCIDDAIGFGQPIYTFLNMCREEPGYELGDGAMKIVVNAEGYDNCVNIEQKALLRYLNSNEPTDIFTWELETKVQEAIEHKYWRTEYMVWEAKMMDIRREAIEEGREEGREETIKCMLRNGMNIHDVAKYLNIDIDEVKRIDLDVQ